MKATQAESARLGAGTGSNTLGTEVTHTPVLSFF